MRQSLITAFPTRPLYSLCLRFTHCCHHHLIIIINVNIIITFCLRFSLPTCPHFTPCHHLTVCHKISRSVIVSPYLSVNVPPYLYPRLSLSLSSSLYIHQTPSFFDRAILHGLRFLSVSFCVIISLPLSSSLSPPLLSAFIFIWSGVSFTSILVFLCTYLSLLVCLCSRLSMSSPISVIVSLWSQLTSWPNISFCIISSCPCLSLSSSISVGVSLFLSSAHPMP